MLLGIVAGRLHALFLHHFSPRYNRLAGNVKHDLFSSLTGQVLEIGAGTGANFNYLDKSIQWTGADPNPHARDYALRNGEAHGVRSEWVTTPAEQLPFPDQRFDAVICTLTLCSVREPESVLREIRRVIRPGGRFVFLEHVIAPDDAALCRKQRRWRPVFRFCCGCTPDRDTLSLIGASGFAALEVKELDLPIPIVTPHIAGFAVR